MKLIFSFMIFAVSLLSYEFIQTPIDFSKHRVDMTKAYIKQHYGIDAKDIKITPKIIVIHHTAMEDFDGAFGRFKPEELPAIRSDISKAGALNVSAHFLVDRDGSIHQLMPLDFMARHVIGLNYNSIGIENVGGVDGADDLSEAQLETDIYLINYLKKKFPTIEYVIGHYEYRCFEGSKLWLELDDGYRTKKNDPSPNFMKKLRAKIRNFKPAPCKEK